MMGTTFMRGMLVALAFGWAATGAFGSILSIGVLEPGPGGTAFSAVYAISPDGTWAAGGSTGSNVAGTAAMGQAVLWSAGTGLVQVPNDPDPAEDQATSGRGVVVSGGNLIMGGMYYNATVGEYRMAYYSAQTSDPGGGAWAALHQNGPQVGEYNAVRTKTRNDGDPPQETVVAGRRGARPSGMGVVVESSHMYYEYRSPIEEAEATANSFARVGRFPYSENPIGAGWDTGNPSGARRALCLTSAASAQTVIPGGSGVYSEAYGIVPESNGTFATVVGYDRDSSAIPHAFVWSTGDTAMTMLGELSGEQSVATDIRKIGGNLIISGSAYVGSTEHAVLWDSTGVWDATGEPKLVADLLAAGGIDTSDWSSLTRVTSLSDDGRTVGGYGVWAADGTTRGFVADLQIPLTIVSAVSQKDHGPAGSFDVGQGSTEGRRYRPPSTRTSPATAAPTTAPSAAVPSRATRSPAPS